MSSQLTLSQTLVDYDTCLARLVLATVLESMPTLGRAPSRGFVAAILTGGLRRDVLGCDGHRLMTFGILSQFRAQDILSMVDKLLSVQLLEAQGRGGLVCSAKGRGILEDPPTPDHPLQMRAPIGLIPGVVDSRQLDRAIRSGLLDAIRRFRSEKAREDDVPEFQVLPEAIVRSVATRLPRTESELTQVPGMGPKRIAALGAPLLKIVAEHIPVIERLQRETELELVSAAGPGSS